MGFWGTRGLCPTAQCFLSPQVNGLAALGKYEGSGDDSGAAGQSLYVANHAY